MSPYQGGGEMIKVVSLDGSTYNSIQHKFEAGTPNIAGAVGLGEALKWVQNIGLDNVAAWENELLAYGTERLSEFDGVRIIGTAANKASIPSFVLDDAHASDIGSLIDRFGVAIRAGHHCTQPLLKKLGCQNLLRASGAGYNTEDDNQQLLASIQAGLAQTTSKESQPVASEYEQEEVQAHTQGDDGGGAGH